MSGKFHDDGVGLVFITDEGPVEVVTLAPGDEGHVSDDDDDEESMTKAAQPDTDHQSLTEEQATIFHILNPDRVELDEPRERLQVVLERAFARQGRRVVAAVRGRLETIEQTLEKSIAAQPRDKDGKWTSQNGTLVSQPRNFFDDNHEEAVAELGLSPSYGGTDVPAASPHRRFVVDNPLPRNESVTLHDTIRIQQDAIALNGARGDMQDVDPKTLSSGQDYVNAMQVKAYAGGAPAGRVTVARVGGKETIIDGNHRVLAAVLSGKKTIPITHLGDVSLPSVSKADEAETPTPAVAATAAVAIELSAWEDDILRVALDGLGSWDFVIDGVSAALEDTALDAAHQALSVIGSDDMFDQVSPVSVQMAEERAAELVGRRVLADGSIVDNPNPRWAISESTRNMIRERIQSVIRNNEGSDALIQSLIDDHAFSPARAEMVSRTEIADINSRAQLATYHSAQEAGVEVRKRWLLGQKPCQVCIDNAAEGAIPLDQSFQSGDDTAPAHPNCVCAVAPEVS